MSSASALDSFCPGRPLAESIATATRAVHARLNKLIVARLPLALPPRAADPSVYASGLLHVAPIYLAFEEAWQAVVDASDDSGSESGGAGGGPPDAPPDAPPAAGRVRAMLDRLRLPGLMRSGCLRDDLADMTGWPAHVVDEQLRAVAATGHLAHFLAHIRRTVANRPHVLLAYSYIMFMALFAGGRFIRATLEAAGPRFWGARPAPVKPTMRASDRGPTGPAHGACPLSAAAESPAAPPAAPLRFFHFDTLMDGEDLKREYKQRLAESEERLTPREKHDIVQEALCIFENVALVVSQLDAVCAASGHSTPERECSTGSLASLLANPLGFRFRDSVVVTKQRRERSSSRRSSADANACHAPQPAAKTDAAAPEPPQPRDRQAKGRPPMPLAAAVELCPAFSRSVRFDKALPRPARAKTSPDAAAADRAGGLAMTSRRLAGIHVTNWILVAAVGVILLGAILTGRGAVFE